MGGVKSRRSLDFGRGTEALARVEEGMNQGAVGKWA